jgi:hypothetical protein
MPSTISGGFLHAVTGGSPNFLRLSNMLGGAFQQKARATGDFSWLTKVPDLEFRSQILKRVEGLLPHQALRAGRTDRVTGGSI